MCRISHPRVVYSGVVSVIVALVPGTAAMAVDPPERTVLGQGEVTGNNVYIRSGNSLNHYEICKLSAGDRVTIVGEKDGWYEIHPPDGVFSLISGDYVDTADDKNGVVNGDKVRVRAGSLLNDRKYTIQTKLSKGTEVSILGRNPDGFLRIVPPPGVTLWISGDYVTRVPEGRVRSEPTTTTPQKVSDRPVVPADSLSAEAKPRPAAPRNAGSASLLAALPPTRERRELLRIDADTDAELAKPVLERRLEPLIERYRKAGEVEEDEFAKRYAAARIEQLQRLGEVAETLRRVRELDEQTEAQRREFMRTRATMTDIPVPTPSALDAQGELRVSALYPPGSQRERYRLVDAATPPGRTIAYVDIPAGSGLDASAYVGRYVGVRAAQKRLQRGGVNPVPIYVARELVLLEPAGATADGPGPG